MDDKLFSQEPVIFKVKKPSVGPCRGSEDEDVGRILLEKLEENIKEISKQLDFAEKMTFTDKDRHDFNDATHCWIC